MCAILSCDVIDGVPRRRAVICYHCAPQSLRRRESERERERERERGGRMTGKNEQSKGRNGDKEKDG